MKQNLKIGDLIQLSENLWINIWHKDLQGNFVPKASNDHQRYFLVTGFCETKEYLADHSIICAEASIFYVEVFCLHLQQKRWIREWDLEAFNVAK